MALPKCGGERYRRVGPPPSSTGAQNHRGRFQTLPSPQEVFRSISELAERSDGGKGVAWPRHLQGASPAKRVPFTPEATWRVRSRPTPHPPPHLPPGRVSGNPGQTRVGLGELAPPLPSPAQESRGRELLFVRLRRGAGGGGVAPSYTPLPAARPGGGGARSWGKGGPQWPSQAPPPRLADLGLPPPPAAPPQPPPVPKAAPGRGGPGRGRGVVAARGQGAAAGPGWNKVRRPGPGSSRRPARLRRAVCKHKVSQ